VYLGDAYARLFLGSVLNVSTVQHLIPMSSVSSRQQKRLNAHLEHLAREAEIETNRRRFEIMELRRLERMHLRERLLTLDIDH